MTALVGVFGAGAATAGASLPAMFARMRNRGAEAPEQFAMPGALIAARRHEWEARAHGWSGPVIAVAGDWVVAADASLYYLDDLRRQLSRHAHVDRRTPYGALLIAALRTWGGRFARQVEGDYALIALHRQSGRVLLARDFAGRRSLALSVTTDGSLVVASSPLAVVEFPGVSRSYDLGFIATSIAGLLGHGHRTAFEQVGVVPGGGTMAFEDGRLVTLDRWSPPPFSSDWEDEPSDRAAERLRGLIEDAVAERLPASGTASVWMSGGWDSTSVFASGCAALERTRKSVLFRPISLKYPEGDTGDETPFVEAVARRWNADVRWTPVDSIPLFDDAVRRASVRDDPRVHPFESQIRALCRVSRDIDARVVADGAGGDHLFMASSTAILADHLRAGRIGQLWQSWKVWGRGLPRLFARTCLLPQLSHETLQWIGTVRGRPLRGFWDSEIPNWVRATPEILREAGPEQERDPVEGIAAWETRGLLSTPFLPRALAWTHAMALEEGILLRSPLFDRRLIEFVATRPLNERHGGPDSKVLLRHAMRPLLPDELLEPRGRKTGTPADYFKRQMLANAESEFRLLFERGPSRLERMGIIDIRALREAMTTYLATATHATGAVLQMTIEAERWLASHDSLS